MAIDYDAFFIATANAEGYYRTAQIIREQIKNGFEFQTKFAGPYSTNMGFACELYLKALLLCHNLGETNGHHLSTLYSRLPSADKKIIEEKYRSSLTADMKNFEKIKEIDTVDTFLQTQTSIFVKHRYLHEFPKNPILYWGALNALANALSDVCVNYWNIYNQDSFQEDTPHAD